jgi:hypothetical protein
MAASCPWKLVARIGMQCVWYGLLNDKDVILKHR